MSVTFSPAATGADTRNFLITCTKDNTAPAVLICERVGYSHAYAEAQAHGLACEWFDCQAYGADVDLAPGQIEPVNMSNRNALDVLRVLGLCPPIGDSPCGEMPARKFLDLVATACAVGVRDEGLSELDIDGGAAGWGNARFIDCGRAPGYLARKLADLRDLGEACVKAGVEVITWG